MTLQAELIKWLGNILDVTINTEINDAQETYGLSRSPQKVVPKRFIGGDLLITEYYSFNIKKSSANDVLRVKNDEFLNNVESLIESSELPTISNKVFLKRIEVTNPHYITSNNERYATYSIPLAVTYIFKKGA